MLGVDMDEIHAAWIAALRGYSAAEVRRGVEAARSVTHIAGLSHFLRLCRPALDPEVAYAEAVAGMSEHAAGRAFAWSHPAVYWAGRTMQFELRAVPYASVRKRRDSLMADQWAAGVWEPVPEPVRQIEQQRTQVDPVRVLRARDALRAAVDRLRQSSGHAGALRAAGGRG